MSPGRLLYLAYHRPRAWFEDVSDRALLARRDRRMRNAASTLPPLRLHPPDPSLPPIRFLTGERFAHQTAFCARSLVLAAGESLRFEFFDDGSLSNAQADLLLRLFPGARIITSEESLADIDRHLPASRFPSLRFAREQSPLMRKLIDMRAGRRGPSIYLDSDMLFFGRPAALLEWLRAPAGELYMMERSAGAYVDSPATLAGILGRTLKPGVNTGILALDDSIIDWPALESAAAILGRNRLAHKWAEQTLFAWLLTGLAARPLDPSDYLVCASRANLTAPTPLLRHYVHKAKMPYLASEWRPFTNAPGHSSP